MIAIYFFIGAFILIFPIPLTINLYYDKEYKKVYCVLALFEKLKLLGGYISVRKDGLFFAKFQCGGEKRRLGLYKTKEEAFLAFKEAKEAWIKTLADKYKDQLEPKVYEALYKYEVEP